ncbi:hypothetical protein OU798_05110 [Prolixibacteraceae bacterium Z1-6]|uniref:DUF5723 domain-containing protein n=1 Tax=Draconibacterium aestuarii TaxID=2998507 RepID=A0A9X3F354_9BACT|nr:hypothetical protein [Prolixibacteraceae bacterium Z1-6]
MTKSLFTILIITCALAVQAQWECPSKLAAHLDPVFESAVLVGLETQLSTGVLDGNSINTAMEIMGIDFSTQHHSLYFEGGVKAWWKHDFSENQLFDQYRLGLREMFYQYRVNLSNFTLGLQTSTFDDHYLLNERIAGANYKLDLGRWKLNAYGGTVTKDFARNGIFCTTGFIYDLPTGQKQVVLGNNLGDKNLGGFTLTFFPGKDKKTKKQTETSGEDEFETFEEDEFSETSDEFQSFENDESGTFTTTSLQNSKMKSGSGFGVEKVGMAAYSEFGNWIDNTFYHTGLFASIKLPGDIYLNPEALLQIENSNKGIIYLAKLEKSFTLKSGNRLSLSGAYYGFSEIDKDAMVLNSYSNILAGEVLRMDAANMPFYLLSAKLNIPSTKFHVKLQNAAQINAGNLNEWDIEFGKKFKEKLHVNVKGGMIDGGELEEKAFLGRLEARFYF